MSRIHRGFHRIGIVLAVPALLVGISLAGHEAWLQWTAKDPWAAFPIVEPAPAPPPTISRPGVLTFDDLIPKTPAYPAEYAKYRADYSTAAFFMVLAVALYAAARGTGWVLDGFMGSGART